MSQPLRILLAEDSARDAELILAALRDGGFTITARRGDTEADFSVGLDPAPDLILADHSMPQFSAERALTLLQDRGLDIPNLSSSLDILARMRRSR